MAQSEESSQLAGLILLLVDLLFFNGIVGLFETARHAKEVGGVQPDFLVYPFVPIVVATLDRDRWKFAVLAVVAPELYLGAMPVIGNHRGPGYAVCEIAGFAGCDFKDLWREHLHISKLTIRAEYKQRVRLRIFRHGA